MGKHMHCGALRHRPGAPPSYDYLTLMVTICANSTRKTCTSCLRTWPSSFSVNFLRGQRSAAVCGVRRRARVLSRKRESLIPMLKCLHVKAVGRGRGDVTANRCQDSPEQPRTSRSELRAKHFLCKFCWLHELKHRPTCGALPAIQGDLRRCNHIHSPQMCFDIWRGIYEFLWESCPDMLRGAHKPPPRPSSSSCVFIIWHFLLLSFCKWNKNWNRNMSFCLALMSSHNIMCFRCCVATNYLLTSSSSDQ